MTTGARFPTQGRLAGLDYGTVRIGVAVTDPQRKLASPFTTYTRRGAEADAQWFRLLVQREQIVGFVVGLPIHLSGDASQKSAEAQHFGRWLESVTGVPICYHDERFTSVEAQHVLAASQLGKKKRKARIDMIAAQIMLASYLEASPGSQAGPLE